MAFLADNNFNEYYVLTYALFGLGWYATTYPQITHCSLQTLTKYVRSVHLSLAWRN